MLCISPLTLPASLSICCCRRRRSPTEPPPSSLEALLERQWGQGAQFIMDQAQHYDIASLLSCLHQIRQENERLEERLRLLSSRREHLLTVNARLALPLNGSFPGALPQMPPGLVSTSTGQLSLSGPPPHPATVSMLPPLLAPPPPTMHQLLGVGGMGATSPLDAATRRLSAGGGGPGPGPDPMALMNGRYPALAMDPGALNSIFPSGAAALGLGERGGFSLNNSLRSTPSPSASRSSPFAPPRPGSVNPRDPLGLNTMGPSPSPIPGSGAGVGGGGGGGGPASNHRAPSQGDHKMR